MNTAANKHKQEGELVVPVVAPALLVRVRHGPGLRTLETCNMHTRQQKNIFKLGTYENWQQQDIPTCMFFLFFFPFSLGPTLNSRSDDRAINHASACDRADTLCEHRMYFMKASEDRLPNDLIWLSDMPWAAAVVAAPIRKLCDLNCLRQK